MSNTEMNTCTGGGFRAAIVASHRATELKCAADLFGSLESTEHFELMRGIEQRLAVLDYDTAALLNRLDGHTVEYGGESSITKALST